MAGDFNGDGRTDLAIANSGSSDVSVLLGNGDGTFQPQVTYAVGIDPYALVAGDFNGDGRPDLAVANSGSNDVSVLLGNGDGTFQHQVTYAVGTGPTPSWRATSTATAAPTWPSPTTTPATCRCCWATATAPSSPRCTTRWGPTQRAIVAGDFNGDGRTDLAIANGGSNDVSVLLGNGDGTFQTQVTYPVGSLPDAIVAGDFDRRRPHRPGCRQPRLRRRVGVAGQRRRHVPEPDDVPRWGPVPHRGGRLQRRRQDRPGRANYDDNDVSVLLGNGDGTFQDQVTYAVGTEPDAIVAGDFNGDGRTDLAVANTRLQRRVGAAGQRRRHLPGPGARTRWGTGPIAVVAGDFNGDGRTDLAVANYGLRTTCRCCWATATAPSRTR